MLIANYLCSRERVADTLDGITHWWILRQQIYEEKRRIEEAVEYLCKQGSIEKRVLADGTVLYIATAVCRENNNKAYL